MVGDVGGDVVVVEHDPDWPVRFARLRERLATGLAAAGAAYDAVEHVGSTSVPGLAAKPVIDCDVVVSPDQVAGVSAALVGLGFAAVGDLGVPLRWAFREPAGWPRANVYVVVTDSPALRNHLGVRDVLRRDPVLREEYAELKRRLGRSARDIDTYTRGKSDVIQRILVEAGLDEVERAEIARANE